MTEPLVIPAPRMDHPDAPPIYNDTYSSFISKSHEEVQDILRQFPVVVLTGRPTRLKCDLKGVAEFGPTDVPRVMHGTYATAFLNALL